MTELTARQRDVLTMISAFIRRNHVPPTVRDLAELMGTTSNAATYMLGALERKGAIRRVPWKARAIQLVDHEQDAAEEHF